MNQGRALIFAAALALGLVGSWWLGSRPDAPRSSIPMGVPERVLLFAPNLSESAWALGHGDKIVGVTDFCVWPPELLERPRVGGMIDPNLERILALSPDLLVVQGESAALHELARSQGLHLAVIDMDLDLASVLRGMRALDALLSGDPDAAPALVDTLRARLDAIAARALEEAPPRVLLSLGHDPQSLAEVFTVGSGGFLVELVEIAGGVPAFADHPTSYFQLSLETLLADPPDVVVELRPGQETTEDELRALRRLWADALGEAPRVEVVDFDGALIPGPRVVETAAALQRALHPGLADIQYGSIAIPGSGVRLR